VWGPWERTVGTLPTRRQARLYLSLPLEEIMKMFPTTLLPMSEVAVGMPVSVPRLRVPSFPVWWL
jgi:hypothetical protein